MSSCLLYIPAFFVFLFFLPHCFILLPSPHQLPLIFQFIFFLSFSVLSFLQAFSLFFFQPTIFLFLSTFFLSLSQYYFTSIFLSSFSLFIHSTSSFLPSLFSFRAFFPTWIFVYLLHLLFISLFLCTELRLCAVSWKKRKAAS